MASRAWVTARHRAVVFRRSEPLRGRSPQGAEILCDGEKRPNRGRRRENGGKTGVCGALVSFFAGKVARQATTEAR